MTRNFVRRFQTLTIAIRFIATLAILGMLATHALAQNAVPLASQPLVPDAVAPGGAGFTLTVDGAGFVAASVVHWNGSPRATTFVSSAQLTAAILASDIATASTAAVTVVNPSPGGGVSNTLYFSTAVAETSISFAPAVGYFPGGYYNSSVAIADLNRDGKLDFAVTNWIGEGNGDGSVGILLGNGDGTFQTGVAYDSGAAKPQSVAVADVNGDGKPDLVVANYCTSGDDKGNCVSGAGGVGVLLGNGDGTFQPAVFYVLSPGYPASVAVADLNGDGKLDIVVGVFSNVDVMLGNGDGTFQPAVFYSRDTGSGQAYSVAIADVNNDGVPDLVTAGGGNGEGIVSVLLGKGDGTFRPAVAYATGAPGGSAMSVAVADVNGDGKPDLVVANAVDNTAGTAGVLLGNGDGTFQPVVLYGSGAVYAVSVAVADMNGDGKPDVAVGDLYGAVGVVQGNGDGTFQPVLTFPASFEISSVAIADLNGDGRPDVAAANMANEVEVLLNNTGSSEPTATTLISSLNPSNYGQSVTFTATVTSSSGTPTGTVIFYDGSTTLGSATLASGSASISTSSLSAGSQSITAAYQGSGGFAPSTSPVLTQVVNGTSIATTTTLATSKNPGIYQQPVTFTAIVSSASGTPTGTVVFIEDGKHALASATLVNGSASFTTSSLKRGKYAMTASYLGSGNFQPSTSPVLEEWINLSGLFQSHIVLRGSGSPSLVGQPVTFTAYVTSKYGEIPDGDVVDFYTGDDGGIGTATTHNGQASITTSSLRAGVLTIFAYYEGDDDFHSSFTSQKQRVDKDPTTTTITASPNPAVYGQAVTYTATVTSSYGTPTGAVRISDIGLVPLVNGVATITKNLVRAGTHDITASYQSDSDFARSTSPVYKEVVTPASTTTVLTSSANPSSLGQTVTFTATVTSSAGVNPFGTVTFTAGGTTLGTVALKDGVASVSTASLPEGSTLITATYNGADSFSGSSASLTQVVNSGLARRAESAVPGPREHGAVLATHSKPQTLPEGGGCRTATSLSTEGSPSLIVDSVTFTAQAHSKNYCQDNQLSCNQGAVVFSSGGATLGTVPVSGCTASLTTTALTLGAHIITATFKPGGDWYPSSARIKQVVVRAPASVTLRSSPNPSTYKQDVVFAATAGTTQAGPGPTGKVRFYDGSTSIGVGILNSNFVATFGKKGLAEGTHSITAEYLGDSLYANSTSTVVYQVVNPPN